MNWDNVENIRNAQASAQARFDAEHIATQETIKKAMQSEAFQALAVPHLTELESMIFKMRSELIDYIVAHGLVDGLIWDGVLQPVEGGKIVITKELIETITEKLGYYKKDDVERLLGEYLPEHDYVSDPDYTHTDNNYTTEEKNKLSGIEDNAEVNKIIDLVFNGVSVLDDGTRVATITITPEDIKTWYESNPNTNAFTDSEKSKLAGISDGAEVNRVDDVLVDGRSVLDDSKKAKVTKEIIKTAYESNPDTNAFTDSEKQKLADLDAWKPEAQKAIDANAQGVAEAKTSISELGDEVNSVAGRVTTLENTKLSVITVTDEKIKDLTSEGFADGFYNLELKLKAVFKDAENHQRTFNVVQMFGYGLLSGGYIGAGPCLYGAYQSAASSLLQSASFIMNDDLVPVLQFVLDSSKDSGFIPVSVMLSEYSLGVGSAITQIQLDGEQLDVSGGVVNIKGADKYVPYSGANADVDLGDYAVKALELNTGELVVGAGQLDYTDGITGKNNKLIFSGTDASFTDGANSTPVFVADPTNDKHAATKKYVDSAIAGIDTSDLVPYTGALKTIDVNTQKITNVATPTSDTDVATKKYVDENAGGDTSGLVPYEGATNDVNLAGNRISSYRGDFFGTTESTSGYIRLSFKDSTVASAYPVYLRSEKRTDSVPVLVVTKTNSNVLANIKAKAPTEDDMVATKAYVDSNASPIVETTKDDYDIRVITMTSDVTVTASSLGYYDVIDRSWTTVGDSFTLKSGQKIIFAKWKGSSDFRSIAPLARNMWLYFSSTNSSSLSIYSEGITGTSGTSCAIYVPKYTSITSGDIISNSTSKFYKFV